MSAGNECKFCTAAHNAIATILLNDDTVTRKVQADIDTAPISEKMKTLLKIAKATGVNGKQVTREMIANAKAAGATDAELHDTVLIAALFSLYNRYVDGLASVTPEDPAFYNRLGMILKEKGYVPSENRYANL